MDIPFDETYALADDRDRALQQLVPGTDEYYYYHCLRREQEGRPEEVAKLLAPWIERLGRTARVREIENRRTLYGLAGDPKSAFERLRRDLGLSFNHQREVEGRTTSYPTRLDPKEVAEDRWRQEALSRCGTTDLSGFGDAALDRLAREKLDPDRRRALLERLERPDVPGLADLVLADLKHKNSSGFGSMTIHGLLTREQLAELAKQNPALLREENFVTASLLRLRPGPEWEGETDLDAREAWLDELWAFVEPLVPAFNGLKAHVLYHRLDLDRSRGTYDRKRFQRYLEIPREVGYAEPKFLERCRKDAALSDGIVSLGGDFDEATGLPAVSEDEGLVADYLSRFFADAKDWKPWETWIRDGWLKRLFAETKILAGAPDVEKWTSLLNDPARFQALKDRVELSFPRQNRTHYRADEPVKIEVDVKNVETLVVKVFEINALNYYLAKGEEPDTTVDLDGLVAAEEKSHAFKEPPLRRVRRSFEFPSLSRPGVFVVEFIGGGISSRALIRKGRLRVVERVGAAGHVFTVLDEALKPAKGASIWLGGREYAAEKDGSITIPFTERPGTQSILLRHGGLATLESFEHLPERYDFTAGLYVDREALLRRAEAQVLLRPSLRLHGGPASLSLLEEPALTIVSTDRFGVSSSMEIRGVELREDRETVVPFQVPDDLASISFTVRGRVRSLGSGKLVDLSDSRGWSVNGIEAGEHTEDLHLSRAEEGFVLYALGKTGEFRPDMPVNLTVAHRRYPFELSFTLQSDARGRVELGALPGVTRISASLASGASQAWAPPRDACLRPAVLHLKAGDAVRVPFFGEKADRDAVALLERGDGTYRADRFDALSVKDGYLTASKLAPGDYELRLKDEDRSIELKVSAGDRAAGWLASPRRLLEESDARPVQISGVKAAKDELRIKVENASPATRVHVVGTRYLPLHSAFHELGREGLPSPRAVELGGGPSAYVSGRDLGDEYRYILERRRASRLPGNMLARPGLLLNPWAVRATQTDVAEAAGGGEYGSAGAPARSMAAPACAPAPAEAAEGASFSTLDFLAAPSAVLANLRPGADGVVAVPRKGLAHASQVRVVAVDPSGTVSRDYWLPEPSAEHRDLRLRLGLDPAGHFTERKEVSVLDAGQSLRIEDLTTSKLEVIDTLGRAYGLYRTLQPGAALDAFEFVTRWPKLNEEERRAKYSEFACHELHLFLSRKDPEYFRKVVQPYLRNKKDKTFLDRWLLENDLTAYLEPWAFGRLNVVERILLGKRIAAEKGPLARHAADLCELLRRDIPLENRLFETALKGKALETGDALGMAAARDEAEKEMMAAAPAMASMMGPGSGGGTSMRRLSESKKEAMADLDDLAEEEAAPKAKKAMAKDRGRAMKSDLARRQAQRGLYRTVDKTQEWAENNWYQRPIAEQGPELVTINRFWRDYAAHDGKGPFASPHLAEACRSFTEIMCALAVLDLPFEAEKPGTKFDGARMDLTPKGRAAVFHRQIRPSQPSPEKVPVLVSQNFLRDDNRVRHEGGEQYDKYVTDEFLVHTVYACQVVLTNPTSTTHKLDLLLQIPVGALPAKNGFQTKGVHVELASYATETIEYAFYFPAPGTYQHYPVHVSRNEQLVASATPWPLKVVQRLSKVDETSWAYLSQHADDAVVLKYLEANNVERLDLSKIAWRMKDAKFYAAVLPLLEKRHAFRDVLWTYAVHHKDLDRTRQLVLHREDWLRSCGTGVDGSGFAADLPVQRRWYQHLEYAPLVNARAHRLGAARRILNGAFAEQYARLMAWLRYRKTLSDDDRLAVSYYLFLQDRVEEGLAQFDRVGRDAVESKLQYDYLKVYAEFYREKPKAARAVAEKHKDHPVDRWRKLFRNALAQLDEIEGEAPEVVDAEDRDQRQGKLAATASAFELAVEDRTVKIQCQNLEKATVNYYRMDLELLFSRQPFVQEQSDRFGFIMPNRTDEVALPKKGGVHEFPLPSEFKGANVVVEVVADGRRVSKPCFAHELAVQVVEAYGQVRVAHRKSRAPVAKAYVKAYARQQDGTVRFFKDGYTDLRGRFEYSSLSTDDLDRVDRFALLVMSDEHGAVVREAAAPKR
jgi:hypothetical protein